MADEYGTVGLGAELDGDIVYHFCYQATAPWTIGVNCSDEAEITATITQLGGGASTVSASGSGLSSISLPASTFCYVKIGVTGGGTVSLS